MGTRHCLELTEDRLLEWGARRVRNVYLTVKFELPAPFEAPVNIVHECLYCSCHCEQSQASGGSSSGICEHCLYYPESHSGRCIGKLHERSGSIAYMLRNPLENETVITSRVDGEALEVLRPAPFGFEMIEEVRQRYRTYPLGNEPRFDRSNPGRHFIVSVSLNGYEGYRHMLTNTSSMVEPMSHEEWHRWYRTQIRMMTHPIETVGCKTPLPRPLSGHGMRTLRHVVVETDLMTGSRFYTASPRIQVGADVKYIRLELTSSLPDGPHHPTGSRQLGISRSFRCVTTKNVSSDPVYLAEDLAVGGYPIATLEGASLKQFHPSQGRNLHYITEYGEEFDVSEAIPLAGDDRYLRIFLTSD